MLRFGTAGIRALMGPGRDRMNPATVARCAAGLLRATSSVEPRLGSDGVVVGYDGRVDSDRFADVVVAVAQAAGVCVHRVPGPCPTPLVSFATRELGAALGVMVTASHNPPEYSGLKVFTRGGGQLLPPRDAHVEAEIEALPDDARVWEPAQTPVDPRLETVYVAALDGCRTRSGPLGVTAVYSALHGVGQRLFRRVADRNGIELVSVVEQSRPDPAFPTAPSPNPEDPASLRWALKLAEERGAPLVLVHDPDADRLAAAVRHEGDLRVLTGDQIGCLLGDHLLRAPGPDQPVVASTFVSSRMIERVATARGAHSIRTPTGFRWMARAAAELAPGHSMRLAYEQALGYSVADVVRDKDGLGAALGLCEAFAAAREEGQTLVDRWNTLSAEVGIHWTQSVTERWEPGEEGRAREAFARFTARPPLAFEALGPVERVDHRHSSPPLDLVVDTYADGSWLGVRPSGTEPKLKVYIEVRQPWAAGSSLRARDTAQHMALRVRERLRANQGDA